MAVELIVLAIGLLIFLAIAVAILAFAFWIWMIIDCAKRNFKKDTEKIVWILIIVLVHIIGALIYYFVVKIANKKGIAKK